MKVELQRQAFRLASPLHTSYGTVSERVVSMLTLTDEQGVTGVGEAAPLEPYDGVPLERAERALEHYRPLLEGAPGFGDPLQQLLDACRAIDDLPAALAAVDIALWDLAGRRAGRPVAELLCPEPARSVPVNATVTAEDRAGAAEQASAAARAGFGVVKVKVGVGDDAGRVAAVRAAVGPTVGLRVDANGAWSVPEAVAAIGSLEPAGLELVEEPTHGLENVRRVREAVRARVAIDETAAEPGAPGAGAADAVCLKLSRCGGIAATLEAAAQVRSSGAEVYLTSGLDGPVGVAAALHTAAALLSDGPLAHCGLATLPLFEDLEDPLPARGGEIALPDGPGLGLV
ncbi:MAG TPA: mandelate racemase/muconate lactonizing enzyme family protein [Solirubrobacteraceae bacterium]|nr:mandelate racemase/muconate lactonizing enzyme family protein [Solirubrobacteraceae bacterium]